MDKYPSVEFMGWADEPAPIPDRKVVADDHDTLRVVLLADNAPEGQWVQFRCYDGEHAYKVRRRVLQEGFHQYDMVKRGRFLYVRKRVLK